MAGMKQLTVLLPALIVGAVLFSPAIAYAEDPNPDVVQYEVVWEGTPHLDCSKGIWWADNEHDIYEKTISTGEQRLVSSRIVKHEFISYATGDDKDADCTNWRTHKDGTWYKSKTPATNAAVDPETGLLISPVKAVISGLLKVGLA